MALKFGLVGGLLVLAMLLQPQPCNAFSSSSMGGSAISLPEILPLFPFMLPSVTFAVLSWLNLLGVVLTSFVGSSLATMIILILVILLTVVPLLMRARTILLVEVGLARRNDLTLLSHLQQTARDTDPSSEAGLHRILTDTMQELLKDPQNFICGYSYVKWTSFDFMAAMNFEHFSITERGKLGQPLVSVNEENVQRAAGPNSATFCEDCTLVTILVAVKGIRTIPTIRSVNDMKKALQTLNTFDISKIKALEVLWTPNDGSETMTQQNLFELCPDLRTLRQ